MSFGNQRMWDLIRHQRSELHLADLITDEEYYALAKDHSAVARLEDYDKLKAKLTVELLDECIKVVEECTKDGVEDQKFRIAQTLSHERACRVPGSRLRDGDVLELPGTKDRVQRSSMTDNVVAALLGLLIALCAVLLLNYNENSS